MAGDYVIIIVVFCFFSVENGLGVPSYLLCQRVVLTIEFCRFLSQVSKSKKLNVCIHNLYHHLDGVVCIENRLVKYCIY